MLNELQNRITSKPGKPWTEESLRTHSQSPLFAEKDTSSAIFDQELKVVQSTAVSNDVQELLATFPCKPIAGAIASALNESVSGLFALVSRALAAKSGSPLSALGQSLEKALVLIELPERTVEARS